MPISTDLNVDPYFDDFDNEKQYHRVLFKPSYAVQARELTQLQTTLQNQIEEFGGNVYKEGTIIKGCNFTEISDLQFVKLANRDPDGDTFDPEEYVGYQDTTTIDGITYPRDVDFEIEGDDSGVRARIIAAARGFETRAPNLNTFFIRYITTSGANKVFTGGENLKVYKMTAVEVNDTTTRTETEVAEINVTDLASPTGGAFGLTTSPGIIYQKGHFLYSEEQTVIVSKYTSTPDDVSVGFVTEESIVNSFQDSSLYDNANGSPNQNAPGADRLKLKPVLTAKATSEADEDTTFFTLTRYKSGNAIQIRDVPQFNAIETEMARRTYEESGDYVVNGLKTKIIRRDSNLKVSVGAGVAYVKGSRVENSAEFFLDIDDITTNGSRSNQAVTFEYGGYLELDSGASTHGDFTLDDLAQVDLQDNSGTDIGSARVRSITDTKIFLFDIRMDSAQDLDSVRRVAGSDAYAQIAANSKIQENDKTAMIFDTGTFNLKSTSNRKIPVRATKSLTSLSGTSVTFSVTAGTEDFDGVNNDDILFLNSSNEPISVTNTTVSGGDNETITLTLGSSTTATATVYFNKNISAASPFTKESDELFVKVTYAQSDAYGSKYNLGFPDVYEITSIVDAEDNDVTNSFKLRTNQRDNYYDHSYIEFIPGSVLPADGLLTVTMNAFKLNDTTGNYFFTVDSYPTSIDKSDIQPYVSKGKTYTLTDSFDFRPYVSPLSPATYTNAAVLGTAPTVSSASTGVDLDPSFSSSYDAITPAHNQSATIDYDFFFNRTDSIMIDNEGDITLVKGTEEKLSAPQLPASNQLKLADIYIPGPDALTPEEAANQNRPRYGTKMTRKGVEGYTMREIREIDRKVDSLQYYVTLNTLELNTKNLIVLDSSGNDRFKNGIIVDPFNDLNIADTDSFEFSAGFDFTEKSLTPAVTTFPINLKYKSGTTASIFPDTDTGNAATISRNTDVSLIHQRYATGFRNCASNFYNYRGSGGLLPEFDTVFDVVNNPNNTGDPNDPNLGWISDLGNGPLQETAPLTSTSTEVIQNGIAQTVINTNLGGANQNSVGDFVSNFTFEPYMRGREIVVYLDGLRPNTRHYFFFDQVDVNAHIAPAASINENDPASITRNGEFGDAITTDDNGSLQAIFALPEATFYVGERELEVADVSAYSSIESGATSGATLQYNAYNFSAETRTITRPPRRRRRGLFAAAALFAFDPIAQTFFVKKGMGLGSNTILVSKLDLYFKRKSDTLGVTVELREVVNGYPSAEVVPFGRIHLASDDVSTSDDASEATTVTFDAPIRLEVEKEYAFVVIPDASNPDYLIFTSKVGGTDLSPGDTQGLNVIQDWGDGVLFTSTNNRAWTAYQDEDIKFNLYRHNFNVSSGTVTLTNDDNEFFTVTANTGTFTPGEIVYKTFDSANTTANTASVTSGNNQITGTGLSSTYAAGDFVLFTDGGANNQIFKVESANSTVLVTDRKASFTDTGNLNPIALGTLSHYNTKRPDFMILEGSNATTARKFEANDTIVGFDSEAEAVIDSVDDINLSYIQPLIQRSNDTATRSTLQGIFVDPDNTSTTYNLDMSWNDKTTFGSTGMVVFSKSNDIDRTKTLDLKVTMTNDSNVTSSPLIDIESSSIIANQYKITESSSTTSRYISKKVTLAENLDAEDFQIILTAYRPRGTEIKVFIKPQAVEDPGVFENNDWIELEYASGENTYTSISNIYDFREYKYQLADANKSGGVLTYTNDISTFIGYRNFAIKIELHSEDIFKAPRVLDYRGMALT